MINHASWLGNNPNFVQASGGNISLKEEKVIWVKASGVRLKEATQRNIFLGLDLIRVRLDNILEIEDFVPYVTSNLESKNLVPSLETNFHVFLKNRVVTHVHSLGAVALSVLQDYRENPPFDCGGIKIQSVPYAKPGSDLVRMISEHAKKDSKVILLQNHGAIFSGSSFVEVEEMIQDFEESAVEFIESLPRQEKHPSATEIFKNGILTPDEAVFLDSHLGNASTLIPKNVGETSVDFSGASGEVFDFYIKVSNLLEHRGVITYISDAEVKKIVTWDREIFRKAMSQ